MKWSTCAGRSSSPSDRRDIIAPMTAPQQSSDTAWREEMARECYGYGRWAAPYWFIGPEQGQGHDDLRKRYHVWRVTRT
jgi:hypothetical protein